MIFERTIIVVGANKTNCHIIWSQHRQCVIIDPGGDGQEIIRFVETEGLNVQGFLLTHGHPDHLGALKEVQDAFMAPIWLHQDDRKLLGSAWYTQGKILPAIPLPRSGYQDLQEGQILFPGILEVRVMHLPGHSPGSVGFYFEKHQILVCGDTLFSGIIGNTDEVGADLKSLRTSLRRIFQLPPHTILLPGHGNPTTLNIERERNYRIKEILTA